MPLSSESSSNRIFSHEYGRYPHQALSVSRDDADNRFLECAQSTRAHYLVTGNKRHFPKTWKKTRVANARELLQIIGPQLPPKPLAQK